VKILLVAEGKSELGAKDRDGAVEVLVRRLLDESATVERQTVKRRVNSRGEGGAFFKKAVRLLQEARENGCDAAVMLIDQDHEPDRRKQLDRAQDHVKEAIPRAFGVAIEEFEAWFLADETALPDSSGRRIRTQPDPESIAHPKEHLRSVCPNACNAEALSEIARKVRLDEVEKRCPKGFAPFAKRVRDLRR
jgi:hypothetical protein